MPTLDDFIRLEQINKLHGITPPQQPDVTPPPPVQSQPYVQAEQMNADAQPRDVEPHGLKQNVIAGILGGLDRRGYAGMMAERRGQERQRSQDVYAKVKDLRNEGFQQQQLYNTEQDRQLNREQQDRSYGLNREEFNQKKLMDASTIRDREKNKFASGAAGIYNTETGNVTTRATPTVPRPTQFDTELDDWRKQRAVDPKLQKYPDNSTGHEMWKADTGVAGRITVNNNSNDNILTRQETAADRKEVIAKYNDYKSANALVRSMQDAQTRINSGKSTAIGADDMILLSNHIAMTMGQVKGARSGQQIIAEHRKARDLPSEIQVIVDGWREGSQLSPGQRQEFIHAAADRLAGYNNDYEDAAETFQYRPPGDKKDPIVGGNAAGYARTAINPPVGTAVDVQQWEIGKDGLPQPKPKGR